MPKKSTWEKAHPQCAAATREAVDAVRAEKDGEIEELRSAAKAILWMAALYAEGGGSNGPEMRDYLEAEAIILGKLPET